MSRSSGQGQGHRSKRWIEEHNDMVTCEIRLFQNYFSLRRRGSEISARGNFLLSFSIIS